MKKILFLSAFALCAMLATLESCKKFTDKDAIETNDFDNEISDFDESEKEADEQEAADDAENAAYVADAAPPFKINSVVQTVQSKSIAATCTKYPDRALLRNDTINAVTISGIGFTTTPDTNMIKVFTTRKGVDYIYSKSVVSWTDTEIKLNVSAAPITAEHIYLKFHISRTINNVLKIKKKGLRGLNTFSQTDVAATGLTGNAYYGTANYQILLEKKLANVTGTYTESDITAEYVPQVGDILIKDDLHGGYIKEVIAGKITVWERNKKCTGGLTKSKYKIAAGVIKMANGEIPFVKYKRTGVAPLCDCDPTCSPIPTAAGTYTATRSKVTGDTTHYCDGNKLLLSIVVPSGTTIPSSAIRVKVGATPTTFYTRNTGFMVSSTGNVIINRFWSIDRNVVTGTLAVTSYFTDDEYTALNNTLSANAFALLSKKASMRLFLAKDNSTDPLLLNPNQLTLGDVLVAIHSTSSPTITASTASWNLHSPQAGINAAKFKATTIINGGGIGKF